MLTGTPPFVHIGLICSLSTRYTPAARTWYEERRARKAAELAAEKAAEAAAAAAEAAAAEAAAAARAARRALKRASSSDDDELEVVLEEGAANEEEGEPGALHADGGTAPSAFLSAGDDDGGREVAERAGFAPAADDTDMPPAAVPLPSFSVPVAAAATAGTLC